MVAGAPTRSPSTRNSTCLIASPLPVALAAKPTALPDTVAPALGAVSDPVGPAVLSTVTVTPAEVTAGLPASSLARAAIVWLPLVAVVESQVPSNGADVSLALTTPSTRKSTWLMRPSSPTAAASGTLVPLTVAPGAGADTATRGATLALPSL